MIVNNMIDKKEIERACNSFFKEANLHVAGDIQDFDPEIILNANNDLLNMIRNAVKTYQSKYRENLEMYYICKMALEYLKIVKRGKEQVNNMSVIILGDEDMEALQNGELIHLQIEDGQTVGLATEKWADEKPDEKKLSDEEIFEQFLHETNMPKENIVDYRYCTEFYAGFYIENAIIIQFKKGAYDFDHLVYKA